MTNEPVSLVPRGGLAKLSDVEVLMRTFAVNGARRIVTANLVAHLCEVERRRIHLREAFSSMYDFCVRGLGMSEGAAYRYVAGARVAHRYPVVLEMLGDGRLHLTGLALLASHLSQENHAELLAAAGGKSKAEIERLISERFPKPDAPDRIAPAPGGPPGARDGRVAPLSEGRFQVQFTGSSRLKDQLERALNLMSHSNPHRKLEIVFERALDVLVRELENQKFGKTSRPRRSRGTKPGDVSRKAKREVHDRDEGRCTYVSPSGVRCEERAFLELDHIQPRALGGSGDAENIRLRCRKHNQLWARQLYGDQYVDAGIRLRQRRSRAAQPQREATTRAPATGAPPPAAAPAAAVAAAPPAPAAPAAAAAPAVAAAPPAAPPAPAAAEGSSPDDHDKLTAALTALGFHAKPVKQVLRQLSQRMTDGAPMERLLRDAILMLTKA